MTVSARRALTGWLALLLAAGFATAAAPPPFHVGGQDEVITGDDPIYQALAALAARGMVAGASSRQFSGTLEAVYTRRQLADWVANLARNLMSAQPRPIQTAGGPALGAAQYLFDEFRLDLMGRGVDVTKLDAVIAAHHWKPSTLASGLAVARGENDRQPWNGRLDGTLLGMFDRDVRAGVTLTTREERPLPTGYDRQALSDYFLEWRTGVHWELGIGRRAMRFGPGYHDLLLEDRARPLDQFYLDWHTKWVGRPFSMEEHSGFYGPAPDKMVTFRRYELDPTDHFSLGFSEALNTIDGYQHLVALAVPLYGARFVAGQRSKGGLGNYAFQFDATQRFGRAVALYGEFFADDLDLSGNHTTGQEPGYLAGVRYTPPGCLRGTQYRLEWACIPAGRTYVGNSDPRLNWIDHGLIFGHLYGPESGGLLFDGRHRLTPKLDLDLHAEHYRTFRHTRPTYQNNLIDGRVAYDLSKQWSGSLGYRYNYQKNIGDIVGANQIDNQVYAQMEMGF